MRPLVSSCEHRLTFPHVTLNPSQHFHCLFLISQLCAVWQWFNKLLNIRLADTATVPWIDACCSLVLTWWHPMCIVEDSEGTMHHPAANK